MKLFFNGVALHELGVVVLRGENRTMVGGTEAPDGVEVRLSFGVEVVDRTYALCRARVEQVQLALRAGRGALVWMEAVTDRVMLSREVAVEGPNGPAEPNSDGRRHQVVEFSVAYSEGLAPVAGRGLRCTWTKTGAALVDLGEVSAWEPSYSADRYSPLRAHRSGAAGSVVVKGRMWPAAGLDEGARRAWLAGRATAIAAAMNSKDGTLRVWNEGAAVTELMNRVVRVVSWKPEVKQGSESLGWELTAVYSEFPNESSYAVSEFRVRRERDARTQGVVLTVSGRVGSNSEAACRAKWATILAGVVPGGAVAVPESESAETQQIAADVDGETLLEMAFSNSYRLTDGSVGAHELRLSDVEDVGSGMIRRAVSGQVTATGATWAAAYEAAVGRARVLGEGQGAMLRSSSISVARQNGPAPVAGPTAYSVTVEFAFEFQLRGNRIWMEVRGEVVRDAFGGFGEAVSGSLVAGTEAAAEAELEAWLAAGYAGRMVKQKRVSKGRVELRTGRTANPGSVRTPPDSGSWGVGVNAGEYGVGGGGVGQFVRLDFSLELGLDRTTGQDIAVRHGAEVNKSWRTLERTTRISGVVYAQNEGDAEWAVGVVLGLYSGLGALVEESGSGEREKVLGVRSTGGDDVPVSTGGVENQRGYLVAYQFSRVYVGRLTAADMILECSVSESISHSGVNWVVQPTAYGRPRMQACGYTAGGRVVRASAVAPTEAYAREWVRRYYSLVFPAGMAVPGTRYRKGPEFTVTPRMAPLTDGVFRTDGPATANALVYEVAGSFEEVLVSADYVP